MTTKEKKTTPQKGKMDFQTFISRIENMILTGVFKPRERLIESALSQKFGVSRYTVRDAFKVLETKSLVTVVPFRGVIVTELSQQEVEEIFVIRAALEKLALCLSAQNTTTVDIKVLKKMVKKFEDAYQGDDFATMVVADTNFHDYIFQMSRNKTLRRMINDLRNRCFIIRYSAWSSPSVLKKVIEEHHLIVDAIGAFDVVALNELSEKHISHGKEAYLLRLKAENALQA